MVLDVLAMTAAETRQLIAGVVSLGTGVLNFLIPSLLSYIVAAYLVVVGIVLVVGALD
jgi:hypothetical protein